MQPVNIALTYLLITLLVSQSACQQARTGQYSNQNDPVANVVNNIKGSLDQAIPQLKKVFHSALVGFGSTFVHPYGWILAFPSYVYLDTEKLSTAAAPFLLACLFYKTNRARGIYAFLFPLYKYIY